MRPTPSNRVASFLMNSNLLSLLEINSPNIVYWDSSMRGGATLYAAALDRRIRAVIAQVPFVSGEGIALVMAPYLPCIYMSRQELKAGKKLDLVTVFPTDPETVIKGDPIVPIMLPTSQSSLRDMMRSKCSVHVLGHRHCSTWLLFSLWHTFIVFHQRRFFW